jgi:hypothetical protein
LRDVLGGHVGLIEKNPTKMIFVWEYFVLIGQVGSAGIHQIDARQMVFSRDVLSAKVLFDAHRVVGAALYSGVVGDDDAFNTGNATDARDDACCGHIVLTVHVVSRKLGKFQKRRAGVEQ